MASISAAGLPGPTLSRWQAPLPAALLFMEPPMETLAWLIAIDIAIGLFACAWVALTTPRACPVTESGPELFIPRAGAVAAKR